MTIKSVVTMEGLELKDHEKGGETVLDVMTCKGSRGLISFITCGTKSDGNFSTIIFQDFTKNISHSQTERATEKNLRKYHDVVLANIETIKAECIAYYANQGE